MILSSDIYYKIGRQLIKLTSLLILSGCIEPLEINIDRNDVRLVVNGRITDAAGPHTVTLTRTQTVPYTPGKIPMEEGAIVFITDDKGNIEQLYETVAGVYQTSINFRGQVGSTYTLSVVTKNKEEYTSTPEKLVAVPEIEKVSYELEKRLGLDEKKQPINIYEVSAFVDTKDLANQKDFYKWEYTVVHQIETQPWDHTRPAPRTGNPIPDPLPCCKTCWVTINNNVISLQNDWLINGKDLRKQLVVKLPVNNQVFNSRVYLEINQYSISKEAYDYWNTLKTQVGSVGNIQDPPPAFVQGNISKVNESDNQTNKPLGYFSASSVASKSIFITIDELGVPLFSYVFADDCRVIENSTALKPSYW